MKKLINSILILLFIVACSPLQKNTNSSSGLNGFETHKGVMTYFVNDSVDQFFVKPLKFTSKNYEIQPDFTFRTGDLSEIITVNFSIFSEQAVKKDDVEKFTYSSTVQNLKTMYIEQKSKKKIESRFSGEINKNEFLKIKADQSWSIQFKNGEKINLNPSKKTRKVQDVFQYIDTSRE